jgi:hypothetical protein
MWGYLVHMACNCVVKVQVGGDVLGLISYDPMTVNLVRSLAAPLVILRFLSYKFLNNTSACMVFIARKARVLSSVWSY